RQPAANDNYAYTINTVAITNAVGTNDYEPDGQTMTYTPLNGPAFGSFVMSPDGNYTYTPDGSSTGTIDIEYLVCDDAVSALCDTAELYIYVDITNVQPNPLPDSIYVTGITLVDTTVATNDSDPNGNMDPNGFHFLSGGN